MTKVSVSPQPLIYPTPVVLVGANVDEKPNFMAVAAYGIACLEPPMVAVGIRPGRYTYRGIRQSMTYSVNLPGLELLKETDYCGMVSGTKSNKVADCGFKVFYGKLGNAPMIEQCPVNLECQVANIMVLGSHALIIGRIEQAFVSDDCLTGGKPDGNKLRTFMYNPSMGLQYQAFGGLLGKAYGVGRDIKPSQG